ncbi:Zinc finger, RING/FYVE/PHD-type [Artemisia annua]|uniref:RING-type E3 ubiquitin transferase n=1 Tax=Artemisia annua TaxID=35608 RepID=A0A2U1LNB7_ARTAN|nr:Zinc finger, RING/FYVE/PHD-type [Artemisia annua]
MEYGGGEVKEMPCKHMYHKDCIHKWLGVKATCPVCQYQTPVGDDDVDVDSPTTVPKRINLFTSSVRDIALYYRHKKNQRIKALRTMTSAPEDEDCPICLIEYGGGEVKEMPWVLTEVGWSDSGSG